MSEALRKDIARNYGLILGVIGLAIVVIQYSLGEFKVGSRESSTLSMVMSAISFITGVVLVIIAQKKVRESQGYLTFGEGFKIGFTIYIISALFTAAWMLVYTYVLEPDYQTALLNETADQLYQQENMSDEAIDSAVEMTGKFTSPLMLVVFAILAAAFLGAIISAITAAIMKKGNRHEFIEESEV